MLRTLVAVMTLLPALVLASEPTPSNAWQHERREQRLGLTPGCSVKVTNPHGDLRVRAWEQPQAELIAHLQAPPGALLPQMTIGTEAQRLIITIDEKAEGARVDLTLLLPTTTPLELSTHDGLIEVKGVESHINATSFAGDLRVGCGSSCTLKNAQGSIHASLDSPAADGPWSLESITGALTVDLGPAPNLVAQILTKGTIGSDYSMTVEPTGNGRQKRALVRVGGGRALLELSSERGDITISRSDFHPPPHP